MKTNNRYSRLAANTLILAVGQFGSKFLVYLMMRFYTGALSDSGYGAVSNIVNASTLSMALCTLSVGEAVISFGLDSRYDNRQVFRIALFSTLAGLIVFSPLIQLLGFVDFLSQYTGLITIYVITGSIKSTLALFVRSSGHVKLFALDGIITTVNNVLLNLLLLGVFHTGVAGYVFSVVIADVFSIIFLTVSAKLWRQLRFIRAESAATAEASPAGTAIRRKGGKPAHMVTYKPYFDKDTAIRMLAFAVPMIPTAVMWWVTGVSDGFFVTALLGVSVNGVYMAAYKLPNIISLVSGIFSQAFNMSAVTESGSDRKARSAFYTNVFGVYMPVVYIMAAGLMLVIRPALSVMTSAEFSEAYAYTPFLTFSVIFTCFSSFMGSVYVASKKSVRSLSTAAAGAVVNLILNALTIPYFGAQGAAAATFVSYALVYALRRTDAQNYVDIKINKRLMLLNTLLMFDMGLVLTRELGSSARPSLWYYGTLAGLFLAVCAANADTLLRLLRAGRKRFAVAKVKT
ncbi:hypothetical protein FACS1894133_6220 [Clostridia bacterium]|nr:hypothetical protein FACS1894133_6220 [Clostridia bacterium]